MGLIELTEMDIPEPQLLGDGEYRVKIEDATPKVFGSGRTGTLLRLSTPAEPDSESIFCNLFDLQEGDQKSFVRMTITTARAFRQCFNISSNDPQSWIGSEGFASIKTEVNPETNVPRNAIGKFLPPRTA